MSITKKDVLISIVGIFIVLWLIGRSLDDDVVSATPSQPAAPMEVVEVLSVDLAKEMDQNEIATIDRYRNKIVRVTGDVVDIAEDFSGDPVVYLEGLNSFNKVGLKGFSRGLAGSLNRGANITASCINVSEVVGSVFLECQD